MDYVRIDNPYKYKEQNPAYEGDPLNGELAAGPIQNRKCRDVLCLILFLAFWVAVVAVAIVAFSRGQPHLLAAPFDSSGLQCGYSPGYEQYPYAYFSAYNYSQFVCINSCPSSNGSKVSCRLNNVESDCSPFRIYETVQLVTLCYPTFTPAGAVVDMGIGFYQKSISDLKTTWPVSLAVLLSAFLVSFVLLSLLRVCGACLVITVIVLYEAVLIIFAIFAFHAAENGLIIPGFEQWRDPQLFKTISYTCMGIAGASFLVILCNIRKIRVATLIVQSTAQFTRSQCHTILVPVIMFLVMGVFFSFWIITSIYIFSSGEVQKCAQSPYACIEWDVGVKRSLGLYFFALFWNCQVAMAICQFIIASTAAYWYYSHLKGSSPNNQIIRSCIRAFTLQLGSIAFGALILTVLLILQIFLEIFHRVGKQRTLSPDAATNVVINMCLKWARCCIACFERFVRFISRNAFITMAVTGDGFCRSAQQAFYLIMRSSAQYAILHGVGHLIMLFGKLLISVSCTFAGYLFITYSSEYSEAIYSSLMPTVMFFVISFVVASLFMDVFAVGSDTLLLCYCIELDVLRGQSYACPQRLKGTLEQYRQ